MTYTTIRHPRSGETYAAEIDDDGQIVRAFGPLHHSDPTDPESLRDIIDNQMSDDVRDSAAWLTRETSTEIDL